MTVDEHFTTKWAVFGPRRTIFGRERWNWTVYNPTSSTSGTSVEINGFIRHGSSKSHSEAVDTASRIAAATSEIFNRVAPEPVSQGEEG